MRQTGKRGRKATSLPVRFVHAGKLCKGEKMVELQGYIDRIVFRNEENGYSVLCMKEGNKEEFLVGVFPDVSEGEYLTARGEMNVHPIYGKQLRVQEYEFTAPSDAASTLKYLSSGAIKGIGEALATRIVKKFGDDTFRGTGALGRGEGNQHEKGARNFRCRCRKEGSSSSDVVFAAIWHHSEPWHENIQFLSRSFVSGDS